MLTPFVIPPGLNSDDTTFAAKGRWADGNNVRFWDGMPQVIGGVAKVALALGAGVRDMFAWYKGSTLYVAFGSSANLYVGAGVAAPTDRTPSPFTPSGGWTFDSFGSTLMAAARNGPLYKFVQGTDALATKVTQAPAQITCMLVTPQRQVLALGCNEEISTTFNGACIRGCDLEDYTNWTTSSTNNAFEYLLEGGGNIVAARMVGSYVAVWTNSDLYMGQFIGDPSQTYRFDLVSQVGMIGARAVTVLDGVAYWIAPDLVMHRWLPGNPPEPIPCPILRDFQDNLDLSLRPYITLGVVQRYSEIWVMYGDTRDSILDDSNSRYIAFSAIDGTWFRGQLSRFGILDSSPASALSGARPTVTLMTDINGNAMLHEYGGTGAAFEPLSWFIQSADQYLDNSQRRMMIRGIVQDFEGQAGTISLTLYCRDRPLSTATTKGPYSLSSGSSKKDFRASGKIVSVKFSASGYTGSSDATYMRLGKTLFDTVPMGER